MIKLIGIIIVIIGFSLKLDTIAVVLSAGVLTGLVANLSFRKNFCISKSHYTIYINLTCNWYV